MRIVSNIMMHVSVFLITRVYKYVDVYSPDKEEVLGLTFTNDEEYLDYVSKFEKNGADGEKSK